MEFVNQALSWGGFVLGDFFDERFVVEPVNLLEFPILGGALKDKGWA
jgi:hypothetical protein